MSKNRLVKKGLFLALGFTAFAGALMATTPTQASTVDLSPWYNTTQEQSNWCWDAVDQAILDHYGVFVSQSSIATYVFGSATNSGATDAQAQSALYNYGVSTNTYSGTLSFSDVQAQISGNSTINGNKPVYVHWEWSDNNGGHAVVIMGWNNDTSTPEVDYMDPENNYHSLATYSYMVSNSQYYWISGLKDCWHYN